jgi:hypothetical protein
MTSSSADYSRFATQHQSLLEQFSALLEFKQGVYNWLAMHAMASVMRAKSETTTAAKPLRMPTIISRACSLASAAGIGDERTTKAVRQYLRSVAASARRMGKGKIGPRPRMVKSHSEKIIDEAVSRRRAAIEGELEGIPPSIDKARAALAHEVLREDGNDDGPPDALCAFGLEEARARFKDAVRHRRQNLLSGNAMSTSARGYEPYWYTSYLRYYEAFEPKDARSLILGEARDIEDEMRQSASAVNSGGEIAAHELSRFLDLMFAYGRCRTVRHVLAPIARRALPSVLRSQRSNGAWADWKRQSGDNEKVTFVDDSGTTACAVLFISRYGSQEERQEVFTRSQRWLVDTRCEDGSWRSNRGAGLPISTTTLVLEALKQTGIPADHPAVSQGERFLILHQQPPGLWWEKSGTWDTHITAQVIEYFQSRAERPGTLNSYLKSARSLLLKSEYLALSEDDTDGPLATAAAYHGVEHFLYGCLLQMDSDQEIYADKKGTTIGFNEALGALERTLQERGQLPARARLPYRQQLQYLGTKRDMFIHRAESISVGDAFGFVATCRAFVERYDSQILGFRLCD